MRYVQTEITINAQPALVWQVLLDFASYPQWNTFIRRIEGTPEVGAEIVEHIHFSFLPFKIIGRSYIKDIEPQRYFCWQGSFVHAFHSLGYGVHSFALHERDGGRTHLLHREEYYGPIIAPTYPLIRRIAEPGFRAMDRDLKRRAEHAFAAG